MAAVVVYGVAPENCKFCRVAKEILHSRGVPYKFVDVSVDGDFLEFFKTVHKTVPQIYLDGVHVGDSSAAQTVGEPLVEEEEDDFEW